jgi:hypothetical protein
MKIFPRQTTVLESIEQKKDHAQHTFFNFSIMYGKNLSQKHEIFYFFVKCSQITIKKTVR